MQKRAAESIDSWNMNTTSPWLDKGKNIISYWKNLGETILGSRKLENAEDGMWGPKKTPLSVRRIWCIEIRILSISTEC